MTDTKTFVNVLMPRTLAEKLQAMAEVDDSDRSKVVRRLIAREWDRRQSVSSRERKVKKIIQQPHP